MDQHDGVQGPGFYPGISLRRTRPWIKTTGGWRAEGSSLGEPGRRRRIRSFFLLAVPALLVSAALPADAAQIRPPADSTLAVDQIKPGQKGKGRTVFENDAIEEFDVEVLGILNNQSPKRDVIIARLKGKNLETTGVIAGMSGSPVYIDGKLIGAVAFSFNFAKEAIAGITPIGEMLRVADEAAKPAKPAKASGSALAIPFKPSLRLEELLAMTRDVFSPGETAAASGPALNPLPVPLIFGGFSASVIEKAGPFFARLGFRPQRAGGSVQGLLKPVLPEAATLRPGDPVTLQLVSGDLDLSAVGTVTYVDGNKVLAFGHPLYNLGSTEYAMARARIITVVPALDSSFKISVTGETIGAFTQDRTAGVFGEIGKVPRLIPVNVKLADETGALKEYALKIVNDKLLTAAVTNMALATFLGTEVRSAGDLSLTLRCDVYLENGQSVKLEDMFAGNFNAASQDAAGLVSAVLFFLSNNTFETASLHRVDISLRAEERVRFANLDRVWLDKYEVSPGEPIAIRVHYRGFGGETLVEEAGFLAPNLPAGSEFHLIVGDAASMQQLESGQYRMAGFVPRSMAQIIRVLNNLRKNNRIYFKIIASKPGLFLRGEEMPNLPPAMKSLFLSPRAALPAPTELATSTLTEYQMPVPYVFKGLAVIPVRIRK